MSLKTSHIKPFCTICFIVISVCLAATTAERFFRIDRTQENLHYITDISSEDMYILDPDMLTASGRNNNIVGQCDRNTAVLTEDNFKAKDD